MPGLMKKKRKKGGKRHTTCAHLFQPCPTDFPLLLWLHPTLLPLYGDRVSGGGTLY